MRCLNALLAGLLLCFLKSEALAQEGPPQGLVEIHVSDGTRMRLSLAEGLNTQTAVKGRKVRLTVAEPVVIQGATVIARGAPATAQIARVKRAGGFGKGGLLEITGSDVLAVDGTRIPLCFRATESFGSRDMTWVEDYVRSFNVFSFFAIPVVVGVAAAQHGFPLTLPEGWTVNGYVGIEAAEMNEKRLEPFGRDPTNRPTRFPLWLERDINIGGISLPRGAYSAAFLSTGPDRVDFAIYSAKGILHRMLAITSAEIGPALHVSNVRSVEYTDSNPARLLRIRLGKHTLRFHERFVIVRTNKGSQ